MVGYRPAFFVAATVARPFSDFVLLLALVLQFPCSRSPAMLALLPCLVFAFDLIARVKTKFDTLAQTNTKKQPASDPVT